MVDILEASFGPNLMILFIRKLTVHAIVQTKKLVTLLNPPPPPTPPPPHPWLGWVCLGYVRSGVVHIDSEKSVERSAGRKKDPPRRERKL